MRSALEEDLKEAAEDIENLKATLDAKKREAAALKEAAENGELEDMLGAGGLFGNEDMFSGMDAQQRAEAIEKRQKEIRMERVRQAAEVEQEHLAAEAELAQMQAKLDAVHPDSGNVG